jgi:hypothetical protein
MPGTIANANARQTQDDSVLAKIIELSIVESETLPDAAIQRDTIPPLGDDSTSSDHGLTQEPRAFLQSRTNELRFNQQTV